jgi:hypothetical protein
MSQKVSANVVTIPVIVRGPMNYFVAGLDKASFRVFEDGVEQEVAQLRTRLIGPVAGLVINTSDSSGTKQAEMHEAFEKFAEMMNPVERILVVDFSDEAETRSRLIEILNRVVTFMRNKRTSRKVLLVITGRGSSNSYQGTVEQQLIDEFVQANVVVYGLNIADNNEPPPRFLAELTAQTGGRLDTVALDAAAAAAARIGVEVRNQYELEYTPRNTKHGDDYHRVQVELTMTPGLPPLELDYPQGYYETRR